MTSTGINVGLTEGTRSSSRVLRPPGGGHTDIFGGSEDSSKGRKYHGRNASSILEGTNTETPPMPSSPVKETPQPLPQTNNAPTAPQSRGRVPPGGFSSGLW